MSSCPMYDPNMFPSPKRGPRNKSGSGPSPRGNGPRTPRGNGPRTPRGNDPRAHYGGYNSPRSPYQPRFRGPPQQGYGCPYGVQSQRGDIQQSPRYRSMRGDFSGASPNSSHESNRKTQYRDRSQGLFHHDMLRDPWSGISVDGKTNFKAANYLDQGFMSYSARLQTMTGKRKFVASDEYSKSDNFQVFEDEDIIVGRSDGNETPTKRIPTLLINPPASGSAGDNVLAVESDKLDESAGEIQCVETPSADVQSESDHKTDNILKSNEESSIKGNQHDLEMESDDELGRLSGDDGTGVIQF